MENTFDEIRNLFNDDIDHLMVEAGEMVVGEV